MWTAASRLAVCLLGVGCGGDKPGDTYEISFTEAQAALLLRHSFDGEPPEDATNAVGDDPDAQIMGQYLFFDTGLSGNGEVSCATCHQPEHGFSDPERTSTAIGTTDRHTPTIVNSAHNRWLNWDGRCDTLWCQAAGPLENPDEQGTNRLAVAHYVHDDGDLSEAYSNIFGSLPDLDDSDRFPDHAMPMPLDTGDPLNIAWDGMTEEDQHAATTVFINVTKTIAAYERRLSQHSSPFDSMLEEFASGDLTGGDHLSDEAKQGAMLFVGEANCWACHAGATFTNKEFHNVALPPIDGIDNESSGRFGGIDLLLTNPFNSQGEFSDSLSGADTKLDYLVQSPEEIGSFKTPGLRNLLDTAPYMHGGHFETLTEVVTHYSEMDDPPLVGHREELLLPQLWSEEEIASVVAFLESLQGAPIDSELLGQPAAPL